METQKKISTVIFEKHNLHIIVQFIASTLRKIIIITFIPYGMIKVGILSG